jgi:hypothetical protein
MKFTSLDLYYIDQCPLRWAKDPIQSEQMDPTRKLMKKVILMKAIGRETGWSFSGIASIWDQLFWEKRDITQDSMKESVYGILAARQLYKKLPKEGLETYSVSNLSISLDSSLVVQSSGDFMLSYPDRYETWIYLRSTPKDIRRSPLAAIEHYLIQQRIKPSEQKPFYLVIYYSSIKNKRIVHFRVRDNRNYKECRDIIYCLADQAKRNLSYPSIGEYCKTCSLKC